MKTPLNYFFLYLCVLFPWRLKPIKKITFCFVFIYYLFMLLTFFCDIKAKLDFKYLAKEFMAPAR